MTDDSALAARLASLEANLAVREAQNRYLYALDTGDVEGVLTSFTDDAVLDVINFPPDGVDMHFEGIDEIRPLYEPYAQRALIAGGHNATNVSVRVESPERALLASYFITTRPKGVQGGRYEGVLRPVDGIWRFAELAIISSWGWTADVDRVSDAVDLTRSMFDGGAT